MFSPITPLYTITGTMIFEEERKKLVRSIAFINVSSREHLDTESGNYLVSITSPDVAWRVVERSIIGNVRLRADGERKQKDACDSLRGRRALRCVISARLVLWERQHRPFIDLFQPPHGDRDIFAESIYIYNKRIITKEYNTSWDTFEMVPFLLPPYC